MSRGAEAPGRKGAEGRKPSSGKVAGPRLPLPSPSGLGASAGVLRRARGIKLLLLDVDGILTDGRLIFDATGEAQMVFHVRDGHGMKLAQHCGLALAITVPDAAGEVRRVAQYVTRCPGGQGAVREAIELLLKAQGHWPKVLERYWR